MCQMTSSAASVHYLELNVLTLGGKCQDHGYVMVCHLNTHLIIV